MTALRLSLVAAGLSFFAGSCGAQDTPVQYFDSPSESYATQDEASYGTEHQQSAAVVEHRDACRCGSKPCPGVCRDPGRPKKPWCTKPGDVDRGDCPPLRYRIADCKRAGNPHRVAKWARCSVDDKYSSWFVGGGAAFFRGKGRQSSDGTWGTDYSGLFGHANVWLKYTRDRKQGGEGAYRTDGEPKIISRVHHILGKGH